MTPVLLVAAAFAQEPVEAAPEIKDFRGYIDQARFFVRKEWYPDAVRELEAAVRLPDGRLDAEAWYMLATVRFELGDLEGARVAAEKAHSYSRDDQQLEQAAGLSAFLRDQFGLIDVVGPYDDLTARLDISLESPLFDPDQKRFLAVVLDAHRRKVTLPRRLGLPAGRYLVNGEPVDVAPDGYAVVTLDASALNARGPAATQLAQAEVAVGMSSWFGDAVGHLFPTPSAQVAYSQPVGPLVGGVVFDWTPQLYTTRPGPVAWSSAAFTVGGRLGVVLPRTRPLVIRPSVGYRYGTVPGIELACLQGADTTCRRDGPADLLVYAVGRAHVPMVELSVDYLDRKRTTNVGFGVKAVVEQALGTLPSEADARRGDRTLSYVVEGARGWTATGFRALANVSLAF